MGRVDELNEVLNELEGVSNVAQMRVALNTSVQILRANGHNDAAKEIQQRAINWYEARPSAEAATADHRFLYARMLSYAEDHLAEARQILDELVEDNPYNVQYRGERGFIAATRGDSALAMEDTEWLADLDRRYLYGQNTYWRAAIAGVLGDLDGAVDLLWQAHAEGMAYSLSFEFDITLDPLRDHPEFQELMRPKG
jgi:tetratricopeptide (TPR) repeat protein